MNDTSRDDDFSRLRVLVVDDDEDIAAIIIYVLRDMGITNILQAGDGKDALGYFKDADVPVDLLICDWMMPQMSGLDLLKLVRKRYPDLPFLMVTSKGTLDAVTDAHTAGVNGYIVKPFTPDELQSKVRVVARKILA